MSGKEKIIVVCGPTGIGKTSTAIRLAQLFRGEIISADSMQVFRHMDIGTAKPTPEELETIPHHLINMVDPDENFDAAEYTKIARRKISELLEGDTLPFITGGTGLYIKALTAGLFDGSGKDHPVREKLRKEAHIHGSDYLHKCLTECDPKTAKRLHPNDTYRIIRALEVFRVTGTPMSEYQINHGFSDTPFTTLKIGLEMDRKLLYDRINERVDQMIEAGL